MTLAEKKRVAYLSDLIDQAILLPKGTLLVDQCLEILLHQMCLLPYACPIRRPGWLKSNSMSITRGN